MKKDFKKVVVLAAMAAIMAITPIMSADAAGWVSGGDLRITDYETPARERLRASFPSITDAHFYIILGNAVQDGHDGWGEIELDGYWEYQNRWASLSPEEKESWAYLCALSQEDRDWLRNNHYSTLADCDRTWCVNGGADAAELDTLIAKVTGQATSEVPAAQNSVLSWKQDSRGWWIANPDGSYLINQWYQSPASGLWYYMGADGYMLTNTITPDGYRVNADGVWEQ